MKAVHGTWQSMRRDELRDELIHDPYRATRKYAEPTRCPDCGLVYREGRWMRGDVPSTARTAVCPACHRLRDGLPAGYVALRGAFLATHRDEVLRLVRHVEERERAEHPLQRIMGIADEGGEIMVTTTDAHLARGLADAVQRAYKGNLEFHYNREDNLLRATWSR